MIDFLKFLFNLVFNPPDVSDIVADFIMARIKEKEAEKKNRK